LKNLVLPGIGSFTVVDGAKVSEQDVTSNFFVTLAHLGQSRAKTVTALLRELNEEVEGLYVEEVSIHLSISFLARL
jgi:amyloid beta precursor protein binding protein 1